MKCVLFLLCVLVAMDGYGQDSHMSNEQRITSVIDQFFASLETRDTALMLKTTMREAQIWRRGSEEDPVRIDMRYCRDDVSRLSEMPDVKEIGLDYQITERNGMAVAWVPYEFWIEDEFSHCGIDIFTLFEVEGSWKIMSAAYSVERKQCEDLRGKD